MQATADRVIETIDNGEKIDAAQPQRFPEAASAGEYFRQGDVYIVKLDAIPTGAKAVKAEAQLAPGESQGARHVLDSLEGVRMFRRDDPSGLIGPVLLVEEVRTVTHPEHGHVVLPPGCYEVRFQRELDAELREQRVQD